MDTIDIQIVSGNKAIDMASLKGELEQVLDQTGDTFTLSLLTPDRYLKSVDPAIIAAVIQSSSSILVALLTGIMAWLMKRSADKTTQSKTPQIREIICVSEKDGTLLFEIPANMPIEMLDNVIDLAHAKLLNEKKVRFVLK